MSVFSHHRWHGRTGLYFEWLLRLSCTILCLCPEPQKLTVPPQIEKIPLHHESLWFFSYYFFLLSLHPFSGFPVPPSVSSSCCTERSSVLQEQAVSAIFSPCSTLSIIFTFVSIIIAWHFSQYQLQAAFMLTPRYPGLEVKILYCCAVYSAVQYKVHKSTSTCRECVPVTMHARREQTYMICIFESSQLWRFVCSRLNVFFPPLMAMAGSSRTMLSNVARVDILVCSCS